MSIYREGVQQEDHVTTLRARPKVAAMPKTPSYGMDSPLGLVASSLAAPLYLYASKKGKFDVWEELLAALPDDVFSQPTLDVGCGRGLVLLKIAARKKRLRESADENGLGLSAESVAKAYGVDLFITSDQSGNSPEATFANAASLGLLDHVVLHTADFTQELPFSDGSFAIVTASLSVHNASQDGRRKAMVQIARVCQPGGYVIILDLAGYLGDYKKVLLSQGWTDVEVSFGGIKVMFGLWPSLVLRARKPM